MATIEQFAELTLYVATLPEEERKTLSVDEIYDRWRAESSQQEDIEAIREAITDYENGDRGRPAEEVMAELRSELNAKHSG